ncbi:hypothetical protein [Lacticaseibacillus mingshuiensis]|uniref:Uncharacterized protein n=1 Tax=Lacticaseibacillus mingshuiensis TaxID=2799574 RepID=A0ABW4CK32_9LACO|nr:hypothetical protein [Lacticaseibacillus mingshuiensis]
MAKSVTINELTPDAQNAAVESFAKFYLDKFSNEGLDVIAQIDGTGHIADINQWLIDNPALSSEARIAGLLVARQDNFVELLSVLKTTFNESGIPDVSWSDWFKEQETKIPQGR